MKWFAQTITSHSTLIIKMHIIIFVENVHYNAQMEVAHIRTYCKLTEPSKQLLKQAMERLQLSARAYDRILKVARTIADLEDNTHITTTHIAEAIQYRSLDREGWLA